MKKMLSDKLRLTALALLMFVPYLQGCASMEPGTIDDPGQAVGAPTEPQEIQEGMDEGDDYPEEYE